MESIPGDSLLEFHSDTLQFLRNQYDLDTPGRIDEAIDILAEWLKKQEHFIRKEFPDWINTAQSVSDLEYRMSRGRVKVENLKRYRNDKDFTFFSTKFVMDIGLTSVSYHNRALLPLFCCFRQYVHLSYIRNMITETKDYLERTIIISKGSVERAKKKLDSICTYRTLYPHYFTFFDCKNFELLDNFYGCFLPKLTKDHYRVYALKNNIKKALDNGILDFYRFFLMQFEYLQAHDYCNGLIFFLDYTDANIMELVKWLNISDVKRMLDIMKEGYGMRIKGLHFYTKSKAIDALVAIVKQAASAKVGSRIQIVRTLDKVYEYIPKEILPIEYGGQEKPLYELHKKMRDICFNEFKDYLEEMKDAGTNENLRQEDSVNGSHYMGISGTFRNLSVD